MKFGWIVLSASDIEIIFIQLPPHLIQNRDCASNENIYKKSFKGIPKYSLVVGEVITNITY